MSPELKKEMLGIGLLGLFLFLLVSLISYHPFDPSLNTLASGAAKNWCGKGRIIHIGYFDTTVRNDEFHVAGGFPPVWSFFIRKKDPPHMLLLASGLVLLFFSLSAILQISIGQIHLREWQCRSPAFWARSLGGCF